MSSSGNCACCGLEEDGVLQGRHRPHGNHLHSTLIGAFKHELKSIKTDKQAVCFGENSLTFVELDHFSTAVAICIETFIGTSFVVTNPEEELLIAICLPISEKVIAIIFAILKLGAAYLPLDPTYPEDLLIAVIHKFRPIMVITDEEGPILAKYDAKSFAEFCKILSFEELWSDMVLPPNTDPRWKTGELERTVEMFTTPLNVDPAARPAVVVHTTGITGDPKGVRIGHQALLNRCNWEWHEFSFTKKDVCALNVSISSVDAVGIMFTALLKGATLHIFKTHATHNMLNLIHAYHEKGITRLYLYTHLLDSFLKAAKTLGRKSVELQTLKLVCCLGDDLVPTALVTEFVNFFCHDVAFIKFFGSAEACGNMIYHKFTSQKDADKKSFSERVLVDHVMDNCCLYILSNYLELTKDGVQGEICVAGESVALGYVDVKEDEAVNRFVENPHNELKIFSRLFRTGDYGRIEKVSGKRCLYIEGRYDNQVFYRGQQIRLEELEELIMLNDHVEEVETIVYNNFKLDRAIVGFVLPKEAYRHTLMPEDVRGALSNRIPWYLLPEIVIIEHIPHAGSNHARPSQKQLVRLYEQDRQTNFQNWGKSRLPEASIGACKLLLEGIYKFAGVPVEKCISALTDSFYQLGGTSLNALSVLLYINRSDCQLKLQEFLDAKNLLELISKMVEKFNTSQASANPKDQGSIKATQRDSFHILDTHAKYHTSVLDNDVRKEVIEIMSRAYYEKGALERYNLIHYDEFFAYFSEIWTNIAESQLSVVVRRQSDNKVIAASFNQDFFTPIVDMTRFRSLHQLLEYFQELKGSVLHKIPHRKDHAFEVSWIGSHSSLTPNDNLEVMTLLMKENIRLAKTDNFSCVFTLATCRILQELCLDVLDFELLDEYPASHFELLEGLHPFRVAPTTLTTSICWLVIGNFPSTTQSMDPKFLDAMKTESSTSAISYRRAAEAVAKGDSTGVRKALKPEKN